MTKSKLGIVYDKLLKQVVMMEGKMLTIPNFMDKDDYLQNHVMRYFLKIHKLDFVENRADYIQAVQQYANKSWENEEETRKWLLQIVREGSKEFCYKKVHGIQEIYRNPDVLKKKLQLLYPNCPMKDILSYKNTYERELINYEIFADEQGEVELVSFTFSRIVLTGENGHEGQETIFPLFVDVYMKEGFLISRAKAKSTIYSYTESKLLLTENHIDSLDYAYSAMKKIIQDFGWENEEDKKRVKTANSKMLYNLYKEFSITPQEVVNNVDSVKGISNSYIDAIFSDLELNIRNKEKARIDLAIFVEKYISINGHNEDVFKKGRDAYLVKVGTDDEQELTKIDTSSYKTKPLQCTEAFFDSKKSIIKSKSCNKLNLCFKRTDARTNTTYFGNMPICVQFSTKKTYGVFKTAQYAEEADISNVIQTIFRNYR